ncbi:unnamed protein product [Linum tenue]|uniref:Uncharacterized protein n=1 Tax=Linum tenue TaxID=586396 RepID=A0AAV0GWI1_9ROSI|nr:unnamed protein product [Linum tenue]
MQKFQTLDWQSSWVLRQAM